MLGTFEGTFENIDFSNLGIILLDLSSNQPKNNKKRTNPCSIVSFEMQSNLNRNDPG
jgi:hypothetical protein